MAEYIDLFQRKTIIDVLSHHTKNGVIIRIATERKNDSFFIPLEAAREVLSDFNNIIKELSNG